MSNAPVAPTVQNARSLIERLLDRGYLQAANPVLSAISRDMAGVLGQRLKELEAEAKRLQQLLLIFL